MPPRRAPSQSNSLSWPAESQATFTLQEDLRGARTTVVGATSEIGGNIMVNLTDPSASSIGTILINARTLETDNSFRNRALRSQILKSAQDAHEFIVFEPRDTEQFLGGFGGGRRDDNLRCHRRSDGYRCDQVRHV